MHRFVRRGRALAVLALAAALVAPSAPASAGHAGGGIVTGTLSFTNPSRLPPVGAPCVPTTFNVHASTSVGTVVSTMIIAYVGPVTITGTGSTICENATLGSGNLTLSATGTNPVNSSTIRCLSLRGSFVRLGMEATVVLAGSCTINTVATANITFVSEVVLAPLTTGGGITTPVQSAAFQGAFTVSS